MARKIWLVTGVTGMYDDRSEWVVCAYWAREKAEERARLAEERGNECIKRFYDDDVYFDYEWEDRPEEYRNEYDAKMQAQYYEKVRYYVGEVDLEE